MKKTILSTVVASALFLVGCGSDGSSSTTEESQAGVTTSNTGYFVDSAVKNLDYDCVADSDFNKTTLEDGAFSCTTMSHIRFRIGNLVLGEIDALPSDGYVFPQDVVGVDRSDIYNAKVTEMAKVLQSCDSDGDATNGITIEDDTKELISESLETSTLFDEESTDSYLSSVAQEKLVTTTNALAHLHSTLQRVQTDNDMGNHGTDNEHGQNGEMLDVNASPLSTLTDEAKDTIKYMINEEKLAYDVYMDLYNYHLENNNTEIFQLNNIAQQGETRHEQLVVDLAEKYGIEEDAQNLANGSYTDEHVQGLYDMLYVMGQESMENALKVGCIVEVTDIDDLNDRIEIASASNAQDVLDVFNVLRDGSYNHYWSFDRGLKSRGITDGCCSLGTIDGTDYCHTEYPQNEHGGDGQGDEESHGEGNGNGHGRK